MELFRPQCTSAGIQILASAGSYSINWPEIGTISEDYHGKHRYFQIHPKNYPQYLSRLSAFKRFTIKRTTGSLLIWGRVSPYTSVDHWLYLTSSKLSKHRLCPLPSVKFPSRQSTATSWPTPPLQVPLLYLERPGVEILQQLAQRYARELDYYRISLQVAPV